MESIAHKQLVVSIILALIAFIGLWFAMPSLLRYIKDCLKEKREGAVRTVLNKHGQLTFGELMAYSQMSESALRKTLIDMQNTQELFTWNDLQTGREMWRFKIHPRLVAGRFRRSY